MILGDVKIAQVTLNDSLLSLLSCTYSVSTVFKVTLPEWSNTSYNFTYFTPLLRTLMAVPFVFYVILKSKITSVVLQVWYHENPSFQTFHFRFCVLAVKKSQRSNGHLSAISFALFLVCIDWLLFSSSQDHFLVLDWCSWTGNSRRFEIPWITLNDFLFG